MNVAQYYMGKDQAKHRYEQLQYLIRNATDPAKYMPHVMEYAAQFGNTHTSYLNHLLKLITHDRISVNPR